jgi:hypothetical protein
MNLYNFISGEDELPEIGEEVIISYKDTLFKGIRKKENIRYISGERDKKIVTDVIIQEKKGKRIQMLLPEDFKDIKWFKPVSNESKE